MKKILSLLLTVCAVAIASVSCTEKDKASLSVNHPTLSFEATVTEPQIVTVTASGVEWVYAVESKATWLDAKRDGNTLTVTVTDNLKADSRSGVITITPNSKDIPAKEITVNQKGSNDPVTSEIVLEPSSLNFDGEGAEPQNVKVSMRGNDYTWNAAVEDAVKDWISIESTEGNVKVTVTDNPDTYVRKGKINVVASDPSVPSKVIMVNQKGKVLPPSITLNNYGPLSYSFRDNSIVYIDVTAVNCEWSVGARDENNKVVDWLNAIKKKISAKQTQVEVSVNANTGEERSAYVIITPDVESVPAIKIKVTQEKGRTFISNLNENVEFTANSHIVYVYAVKENSGTAASQWHMQFFDGDIKYNGETWPPSITGTGSRLYIEMYSPAVYPNSENVYYLAGDQEYLPVMTTTSTVKIPYTFGMGAAASTNSLRGKASSVTDTWYFQYENGVEVVKAPVVSGSVKVARDGDNYDITFTFKDDAGNDIVGHHKGALNPRNLGIQPDSSDDDSGTTEPTPPNPNPDPEKPTPFRR